MAAREDTINIQLGEVLQELRPTSWTVLPEHQRTLEGSAGRPDVLIEEPSGWPVVIEAEREDHASAERDALARLGEVVLSSNRMIESAIALVYPADVREQVGGPEVRSALRATDSLEYALYSRTIEGAPLRLPASGWLKGSLTDLAMLVHRAAIPEPRIQRLGEILERGISGATNAFTYRHPSRAPGSLGSMIADVLGQSDDQAGQTRRMAMTVLVNALIFHAALEEADFRVERDASAPDPAGSGRRLRSLPQFRTDDGIFRVDQLTDEWQRILDVNYWPIFATAREVLMLIPWASIPEVLGPLWDATQGLIHGGVTRTHDLTGIIFQRLIADRKFLATYYTRPAAAALLAGLAIPDDRAPSGVEWGDADTLGSLRIGDFACGTGTLLSAAYQRFSLLHELHGGDPRAIHASMMKQGLVGLDVLNIAVHLTAAMLASRHPDVPFDGDCLLTMPYGQWGEDRRDVSTGSLELIAPHTQQKLIERAAAVTAGGRTPDDIEDVATRIGHAQFSLVIMNPPFSSPTNPEAQSDDVRIPSFAAFETTPAEQEALSSALRRLVNRYDGCGDGNAGLATNFIDLAHAKLRPDGTAAFVLPLTAMIGQSWSKTRERWTRLYSDLTVVTIAQPGADERAFSSDTRIAECLVVARRNGASSEQAYGTFVMLREQPTSATEAILIADEITRHLGAMRTEAPLGDGARASTLSLGDSTVADLVRVPLAGGAPWPIAGIRDLSLVRLAIDLAAGELTLLDRPGAEPHPIPITQIGEIGARGPVHRDIKEDIRGGTLRGPFKIVTPPDAEYPTHPVLWGHRHRLERRFVVEPDSEGVVRTVSEADQQRIDEDADAIAQTASRVHFNRDFRFNAQSHCVVITERPCIGGQAWPTIRLHDEAHEAAFVLWSNSTLGLLMYWWRANKRQSGRGNIGVSSIPDVYTLDTRRLTAVQHERARAAYEALRNERFLPLNQIADDDARAELDRRLLVDVLGLPSSLCQPGGLLDLIRHKLALEPQIHGGKKKRVVFTADGEVQEDVNPG